MAAPSLEKLFDFQANLDAGFAADFTANGLPAYFFRSDDELRDEVVLVQTQPGAATGHRCESQVNHTGDYAHDWYDFTVQISVKGERVLDRGKIGFASQFDYRMARAKVLMLPAAMNGRNVAGVAGITAMSLDYYGIIEATYAGTEYDPEPEKGIDSATLTYACKLRILPSAWPS